MLQWGLRDASSMIHLGFFFGTYRHFIIQPIRISSLDPVEGSACLCSAGQSKYHERHTPVTRRKRKKQGAKITTANLDAVEIAWTTFGVYKVIQSFLDLPGDHLHSSFQEIKRKRKNYMAPFQRSTRPISKHFSKHSIHSWQAAWCNGRARVWAARNLASSSSVAGVQSLVMPPTQFKLVYNKLG